MQDFMQHDVRLDPSERELALKQARHARQTSLKLSVWGALGLVVAMLVTIAATKF